MFTYLCLLNIIVSLRTTLWHSSHCCTDTLLDNIDFKTIMKNKAGGKISLLRQQTEKEKVTSWLNKGGEGSREEVNRGGGSKTGGGREASVGPGGREGEGSDSMTGITPKTRVNNATRISNKKKHDRLLELKKSDKSPLLSYGQKILQASKKKMLMNQSTSIVIFVVSEDHTMQTSKITKSIHTQILITYVRNVILQLTLK